MYDIYMDFAYYQECTKCHDIKLVHMHDSKLSEFARDKGLEDCNNGVMYHCKECHYKNTKPSMKKWYKENEDKVRENSRKYAKSEAGKRSQRNAWAKRSERGEEFTYEQRIAIFERDNYICQECGINTHDKRIKLKDMTVEERKTKASADHIIPVSKGGKANLENGQCLCMSCNSKKSNK